jgi:hypothetical protein
VQKTCASALRASCLQFERRCMFACLDIAHSLQWVGRICLHPVNRFLPAILIWCGMVYLVHPRQEGLEEACSNARALAVASIHMCRLLTTMAVSVIDERKSSLIPCEGSIFGGDGAGLGVAPVGSSPNAPGGGAGDGTNVLGF